MSNPVARLERKIADFFGRKHVILTGRGTGALEIALKSAFPTPGRKILIPAVVCPHVANAVVYSGHEPIFCDINLDDYTLDLASLRRRFEEHPDIACILPVHLYGHAADMPAIMAFAKAQGALVIEDAAQACGAELSGQRLGNFGDFGVVSFGHTKILDAGGGAALFTDNDAFAARARALNEQLPQKPANYSAMIESYRQHYYAYQARLFEVGENREPVDELFKELPKSYRAMYSFRFAENLAEPILAQFDKLNEFAKVRRHNASLYAERLQHPVIQLANTKNGSLPLRFCFLVDKKVQRPLTLHLRAHSIDVSNWYPSLHRWYDNTQSPATLSQAGDFEQRIMNLWVEPRTEEKKILEACSLTLNFLNSRPKA